MHFISPEQGINSSFPWQNGCHFTDNILKCIFLNEKNCISIWISLKFVSKGPIDDKPALVQINGLAPNRRQAIIWTNAYPVHRGIYVALGGDELNKMQVRTHAISIPQICTRAQYCTLYKTRGACTMLVMNKWWLRTWQTSRLSAEMWNILYGVPWSG